MENDYRTESDISRKRLKLNILTGLCAAASVGLGFLLVAVPNIELITAAIFLSGLLLGIVRGILVGLIAEFLFTALNPMGLSFPPLLIAQLFSMAIAGACGGALAGIIENSIAAKRIIIFGISGFLITLNYDFWTTMSFPVSAGFGWEQTLTTLKMGIPFAILHLGVNTLIFALVLPPAYTYLKKMTPVIAIAGLILLTMIIPDENTFASEPVYQISEKEWRYYNHEDLADIICAMPGFYHYDLALFCQPSYIFHEAGQSAALLHGISLNSRLHGMMDFNALPPGYLKEINLSEQSSGFINPNGVLEFHPFTVDPDTPYTRIKYHDGYYALGVVDFITAQRLRHNAGFQFGGQVSEFNGRLDNSGVKSENFRGAFHWNPYNNLTLNFEFMKTNNDAKITFTNDRRLLRRTDLFLTANYQRKTSKTEAVLHYFKLHEGYFYHLNNTEFGYSFAVNQTRKWKGFRIIPTLYLEWYKAGLADVFHREQGWARFNLAIEKPIDNRLMFSGAAGIEYRDEVYQSGCLALKYNLNNKDWLAVSFSAKQSPPDMIKYAYGYQADEVFLPGSDYALVPSEAVLTNPSDFTADSHYCARMYGLLNMSPKVELRPSLFYKQCVNRIKIGITDPIIAYWDNFGVWETQGIELQLTLGRWRGFGLRTVYTYQNSSEDEQFIPDSEGKIWLDKRGKAFFDDLEYVIDFHGRYIGAREGRINGGYEKLWDDNIWGARFTFKIKDFSIFWGLENIFSWKYDIIPGYSMIHKEEVWGVNWVFWD
ncbi:hypothetical protein ISS30_00690 [bacterium]|nr:hypothetical protein [bacterium]